MVPTQEQPPDAVQRGAGELEPTIPHPECGEALVPAPRVPEHKEHVPSE